MSAADHAALSERILDRFFAYLDLSGIGAVHAFISMRHTGEIETAGLFERLWNDHPGVRTFAPRVNIETGELESVRLGAETQLIKNNWRIAEPVGQPSDPKELDLIVVPLLCVDLCGFRVGYGKGFYDRFLSKCRPDCRKVGLSFFPAIDLIDDTHSGDVQLDICVTPERVYEFS